MKYVLLLVCALAASAQAATISESCMLEQVTAVSPLREDLNYTRGSGRGVDASFTKENTEARVGNLSFSTSQNDRISFEARQDGSRVYSMIKNGTGLRFQMTIFPKGCSGGKYGCGIPSAGSGHSASLTYSSGNGMPETKLANFNCQ